MPADPMDFEEEMELDRRIPTRKGITPAKSKGPEAPRGERAPAAPCPRRVACTSVAAVITEFEQLPESNCQE